MSIAIDLTSGGHSTGLNTVTISTAKSNDVIVLFVTFNGGGPATGVSSSNTTGWVRRDSNNVTNAIEEWVGIANAPLTNEVITVAWTGVPSFTTIDAFGISGGNTSTPNDSNGGLPYLVAATDVLITTSNPGNDIIIAGYRLGSSTGSAGTGWTAVSAGTGNDFQMVEYKVTSGVQTSLDATLSSGTISQGLGDAFIEAVITSNLFAQACF